MTTIVNVARAAGVSTATVSTVDNNHPQIDPRLTMQELLDQEPSPDAVFVTNHLMTIGTVHVIAQAKLVIPSDVAVISLDDMPWASLLQPRLTAVAHPAYDLCGAARGQATRREVTWLPPEKESEN